uniref:CopG family transcriptional regulator n=1 Tax=Ningiella ruwaisensis TaxID=2364274 RepID=UPI00109F432C|nr:CopG family transcriptional regulator [Ningiella ruwaisensis]
MTKEIIYSDEDIGDVKFLTDFLPSPKELKERNENTKITISLSKRSVEYFKREATNNEMQYQKLIRQLLDEYVSHQEKAKKSSQRT